MRTLARTFLLTIITMLIFSSCSDNIINDIEDETCVEEDDNDNDIIDNSVLFYEDEITAEWKELFGPIKARATGNIESLTRISGTEYIVKGSVTIEGLHYNLEGTFNPFSDIILVKINDQESTYKGSFYVNECNNCSAGASVFFNTREDINSLNYISFNIRFQSDF